MDNATSTIDIPAAGIDPKLAAALVKSQSESQKLQRDGYNDTTGAYTSADEVARAAREVLNSNGLAWMRTQISLQAPALSIANIGSQNYVGDIVTKWMLVHESGAVLRGTSTGCVIAMPRTPHDKAVGAASTYLMGYTLRTLLCLVREDKHATERRLDAESREPVPEPEPEYADQSVRDEVVKLCDHLAVARSTPDKQVLGRVVFAAAWKAVALAPDPEAKPHNMTPAEGALVLAWLRSTAEKQARLEQQRGRERQPGDDDDHDPTDEHAP